MAEAAATVTRGERTPALARIERRRMRAKIKGARALAPGIVTALDGMRDAFMEHSGLHGFREASAADDDAANGIMHELAQLLEAAGAINGTELAATLLKALREQYGLGAADAAEELKAEIAGGDFDVPMDRALRALNDYTLKFATNVADRQRDAIKGFLHDAIDQGTSTRDLADHIASMFNYVHVLNADGAVTRTYDADTWATMVARTEVTRANNAGAIDLYQTAGVDKVMWLSAEDERTCAQCEDLDGEIADITGAFSDGTEVGDPAHPDCRCTQVAA